MNRRIAALMAGALIAATCGGASVPVTRLTAIGSGLTGPVGLVASVYALGLAKVAALAFDSKERLWAATADSTDHGTDGVYLIPKAGAAPIEVVQGLHTPLGLLWHQESLYVASSGRVDAYSQFNGTHFAGHHTVLTLPAGVGETNELVLAPDGRLQMGISAPCDHCIPASKWSAAVVSFLPDGRDLRTDATGIRAPVGLEYFPGTSDLFVTMNQRDDLGAKTPGDWLAVVHPGQAWGFPGCYGQGGAPCAEAPHPVAVLDKHAAVSGVAIVFGQLGGGVDTSALVAEWVFGKVQRVTLSKGGSSTTGSVSPFLSGFKNPVPVVLGSDGTLFVGDWGTGTVYRISAR